MQDDHAIQLTARYDREACAYLELWGPVLKTGGSRLLGELGQTRTQRVVDVGTGVGLLLPDIQSTFPEASVFALDRSPGMLTLAPSKFCRIVCDAGQMSIRSNSFDLALMIFMLFHLENPIEGLREVRRIVGERGRVGTLTWGGEFESRAERIWQECLDSHGAPEPDPTVQSRHEPVNSPEKMEGLLREAGFRSARAWAEDLVHPIGLEHLILLKTKMGSQKSRFDDLGEMKQEACIREARRLMSPLGPEDFISRGGVVYAIGGAD